MNLNIICIGKLKEKYWQDAANEYLKRLARFCNPEITELAESKTDSVSEESDRILEKLDSLNSLKTGKAFVIALDVKGERLNSEAFAEKLSGLALNGISNMIFIIGGSNGFDDRIRKKADLRLSFSDFTFPHQLMRIILLEQIYRSFKINANEKYHK